MTLTFECHYAMYADCRYAGCHKKLVILNVVMLNVVMLSVVAQKCHCEAFHNWVGSGLFHNYWTNLKNYQKRSSLPSSCFNE
jgi:hypothetical protein